MTSNGVLPPIGYLNTEGEAYCDVLSELHIDMTSLKRHVRDYEIVIVENEKMVPVDVLVLRSKTRPPVAPSSALASVKRATDTRTHYLT